MGNHIQVDTASFTMYVNITGMFHESNSNRTWKSLKATWVKTISVLKKNLQEFRGKARRSNAAPYSNLSPGIGVRVFQIDFFWVKGSGVQDPNESLHPIFLHRKYKTSMFSFSNETTITRRVKKKNLINYIPLFLSIMMLWMRRRYWSLFWDRICGVSAMQWL